MPRITADKDKQIAEATDWFVSMRGGELVPERLNAFEDWIAGEGNAEAFADVQGLWDRLGDFADDPQVQALREEAMSAPQIDRPLPQVANDAAEGGEAPGGLRKALRYAWAPVVAIAASIALFFIMVPAAPEPISYTAGPGQLLNVTLADGSVVDLDSSTRLTVQFDDGQRRIELLEGRANFAVAKDHLRPFSVHAGDKIFVAKGTEFSVELINNDVRAILYEGRVAVLAEGESGEGQALLPRPSAQPEAVSAPAQDLMMAPGDELVAPVAGQLAQTQIARPAALDHTSGWRDGRLDFENEPVALAVARMNRYTDNKIILDLTSPQSIRVSGTFKAGQTRAFAEGVAELNGLRLERDGENIRLAD